LETKLNQAYWDSRYIDQQTGWDIGYANPVLVDFIFAHFTKDAKILIPGLGNGYELELLWKKGYKKSYGIDLARTPREAFLARNPDFPGKQYLIEDFFLHNAKYDVIVEQTFFCALDPKLRENYVRKMAISLNPGGSLFGLLFDFEKKDGPPFGGSFEEYLNLFSADFEIVTMEKCMQSIAPRQGNELFFHLRKK
jgi:thiopurine S-methyltransferase